MNFGQTLLALGALLAVCHAQNSDNQFECGLSAEFYPLEYIFVTRSVSARIRLTSNCLRLRDFTLEGFFSFSRRMSKALHPRVIRLELFKNKYALTYSNPKEGDKGTILRKFQY